VLLSQTITLSLNVRLLGGILGQFALGSGCIQTSGGSFQVNQNVLNYLGAGATVQDLLDLANDLLAGIKTPGVAGVPSYSEVNGAVDAFNNGFDECRTFMGYCTPEDPSAPFNNIITATNEPAAELKVSAYPNPFQQNVRFVIHSTVSGQAQLELYNIVGQRIQVAYEGHIIGGVDQVVDLKVPASYSGSLIYKLKVGNQQVAGKLIKIE
jgi:hypothetical protein